MNQGPIRCCRGHKGNDAGCDVGHIGVVFSHRRDAEGAEMGNLFGSSLYYELLQARAALP